MDDELDRFKREIDLREFAAQHGFEISKKESWIGSSVMRNAGTGEKVIIKRDGDGHYIFCSVHSDASGSIIDFAQMVFRGRSIGAVRKELRPWIGKPSIPPSLYTPLAKTTKDRLHVETEYSRTEAVTTHPYLENERAIPAHILASGRFTHRIRTDKHGNAIFTHVDSQGISGFEKKNVGYTGFSSGGTKGLFLSHTLPDDNKIVFAESAIDALSYAALYDDPRSRYASIGGQVNLNVQPELIRAAAARMPLHSEVIAAMDADPQGRKLARVVCEAVMLTGRDDLRFVLVEPFGFKDWNDQLRATGKPVKPRIAESSPAP